MAFLARLSTVSTMAFTVFIRQDIILAGVSFRGCGEGPEWQKLPPTVGGGSLGIVCEGSGGLAVLEQAIQW